ncbi:hypothetical protein WI25_11380 [Burkholderia cepacia]|nr:hypothetical protein WI25_11380 [Burkholderia cepacia]
MESRLVANVELASFDSEIVDGLNLKTVAKFTRDYRMQIGIRNDAGDLYRGIRLEGMNLWLDTLQWFFDHGFADEIGPDGGTVRGCDAIFSRKK